MKKINIFYYTGHCEIVGGDAKHLLELANVLPREIFNFTLTTDINRVFEQRAQQWLNSDIKVSYLKTAPSLFRKSFLAHFEKFPLSKRIIRKFYSLVTAQFIRECLKNYFLFRKEFSSAESKVDIFHFNNGGYPGKHAGIMGILAAKSCGVKTTIMTLQNLPGPFRSWYPPEIIIDWIVKKYCDVTITVAERLKDSLVEVRGFDPSKIITIYHGLEDSPPSNNMEIEVLKNELSLKADEVVLLITANLAEDRKGHAVLFKAMKQILSSHNNLKLLVVGEGEKRVEFENLVKNLDLIDYVKFLGHRSDVKLLNEVCDIALVPSILYEGIPYTIREAMRSSKPTITTRAGGCDEAIEDGVSGLIIEQNNVDALAKSLSQLISNKELRLNMGIRARKDFVSKFLLKDKLQEHITLYQKSAN